VVTVAAVPVKDLANAKERLISILSPAERQELARAMLEDVLNALCRAPLDWVLLVTRDPQVIELARSFTVSVLPEEANRGHTEAVTLAQRHALTSGADSFLTIPGDVPLVTAEEIAALLSAASPGPGALFVPSRSGLGTNGAFLTPPEIMPLKFGEPSFANHLIAARARGIDPIVLPFAGLGLDIDGPEDLSELIERGEKSRAGRLLRELGVAARSKGQA
jgi:2-phospho-L-lactate guanylyltransferase